MERGSDEQLMSDPEQQPLLTSSDGDGDNREQNTKVGSAKVRTAEVLESRRLHKTVIGLIFLDGIIVLIDLAYSFLSEGGCDGPGEESPLWLEILSHVSIAITTLFLIEIPLTLWAFGPRYYNPFGPILHSSLHLFDALIIITTFVLEVVLRGREAELAALLVLLRLWRLVKLVGGVAVGAGELTEETAERLARAQDRIAYLSQNLSAVQLENQALRRRIAELEGQ